MASPFSHTVNVQQSSDDLAELNKGKYMLQLAIAGSVDGNSPLPNVVFASRALAPHMTISWKEEYALNWTIDMPPPGTQVQCSGMWMAAQMNETFSLDGSGNWVKGDDMHDVPPALRVSRNGFFKAVHIIIGVRANDSNDHIPFFVHPQKLLKGGSGEYVPKADIEIWYESGQRNATIMGSAGSQKSRKYDFDMAGKSTWNFHWDHTGGDWLDDPEPFYNPTAVESITTTAIESSPATAAESIPRPSESASTKIVRIVRFSSSIEVFAQAALATKVKEGLLATSQISATVGFVGDGTEMKVELEAKHDTSIADGEADQIINTTLTNLRNSGNMPTTEPWTITSAPTSESN